MSSSKPKTSHSQSYLSGTSHAHNANAQSIISKYVHDIIELSRLYHPAPIILIYLPHLYGLLYASITQHIHWHTTLQQSFVLLLASIFFSNAAHIWDDLADAPLDALVPRTRTRPIPRGAVSKARAVVLCISQAVPAAAMWACFPAGVGRGLVYALPNVAATAYYPFAKRHSNFPQMVLGFCIAYGVIVGGLSVGMAPFVVEDGRVEVQSEMAWLFGAVACWTVMFDSVYAHLDVHSDVKLGIGSTAVAFRGCMKAFLSVMLGCMITALVMFGSLAGLGVAYHVCAVGGSVLSLGSMVYGVNLEDGKSCWWWFGTGFWYTGGAILTGLFIEYLLL